MDNSGAQIGAHLASLNLFREPDGTVEITVSGGLGGIVEHLKLPGRTDKPIDYIEELVIEAAERMKARRAAR